jgi:hypothetical protein
MVSAVPRNTLICSAKLRSSVPPALPVRVALNRDAKHADQCPLPK